jgi:hypothetical protein
MRNVISGHFRKDAACLFLDPLLRPQTFAGQRVVLQREMNLPVDVFPLAHQPRTYAIAEEGVRAIFQTVESASAATNLSRSENVEQFGKGHAAVQDQGLRNRHSSEKRGVFVVSPSRRAADACA